MAETHKEDNPADAEEQSVPTEQEVNEQTTTEPVATDNETTPVHANTNTNDTVSQKWPKKVFCAYWRQKLITLPLTLLVIVGVLMAIPQSRYTLLGMVIRKDLTITVADSQTNAVVTKAMVTIGDVHGTTSSKGQVHLRVPVGYRKVTITKQYYKTYQASQLVPIGSVHAQTIKLVAVGRVVPIKVVNKVTGSVIAGATVTVLDTEATTDTHGVASIVLPTTATTRQAAVSASGYNMATQTITVTSQAVSGNTVSLTPSGSIYFLSNLSGKIDVVKTNLDGTNRQTVLAGTGNEDPRQTVLLASRDWKYLALLAQRKSTGSAELDLIDTSTDMLTNIDEGDATFQPIGWDGDHFIYQVNRNSVSEWQNGQQVLKSFNAPTKAITVLSQTDGSGTSTYDYVDQEFGTTYIINGKVVYTKNWFSSLNDFDTLSGKLATFNAVNPDGSGVAVLKNVSISPVYGDTSVTMQVLPYKGSNELAIEVPGSPDSFFTYVNGQVSAAPTITDDTYYNANYATYLLSPSGNQTFWADYTDGKNTLNIGDQNSNSGKQIAVESDYSPYGWYTDNYLLVSKDASELYIMPVDGSAQPLKISNYYKAAVNLPNYGGGYGGL